MAFLFSFVNTAAYTGHWKPPWVGWKMDVTVLNKKFINDSEDGGEGLTLLAANLEGDSCNCDCVAVRNEESLWEGSDEKWEEAGRQRWKAVSSCWQDWELGEEGRQGKSCGLWHLRLLLRRNGGSYVTLYQCGWASDELFYCSVPELHTRAFFFFPAPPALDEFLSPRLRAPAGWQMYKTNRFIISQKCMKTSETERESRQKQTNNH